MNEYFAILTLQLGNQIATGASMVTLKPAATRLDIYNWTRDKFAADNGDEWRNATVVFFSAEPNSLGT
jgi:hypothetical protein